MFLTAFTFLLIQYGGVAGAATVTPAVDSALTYLTSQQQADGSYIGFDGTINATIGVVLADAAADRDPRLIRNGGASPVEYLASQSALLGDPATASANTAKIAQLVLALMSIGEDPYSFGGVDWIALINSTYDPATGKYGSFYIHHPWAMLALASAGVTVPGEAVAFLQTNQEDSGAFAFNGKGTGADTNATALCLQALVASGEPVSSARVQNAVAYLHTQQNTDGGFPWANPSLWGTDSDSCSTAWVIQGLVAAGEDPAGSAWTSGGNTPFDFLAGMQNPSGAFGLMKSWSVDDLMSTYQAVPAMLACPFPYYADFGGGGGGNPVVQPAPENPGSTTGTGDVQSTGSSAKNKKSSATAAAGTTAIQASADGKISKLTPESTDAKKNKSVAAGTMEPAGTLKKILYAFFGFIGGSVAFLAVVTVKRRLA
jgi:hypothetical protein